MKSIVPSPAVVIVTSLLATATLVSNASAVIIAGNFGISTNDNNSVNSGETAIDGTDATDTAILQAASLDGSQWNHILLKSGGPQGAPDIFTGNTQGGNSLTLSDTNGNSAATMTSAGGTFFSAFSDATDGANRGVTGEAGLMQSYLLLNSNETVTVTLPGNYSHITVYAFFEIGAAGGGNRTYGLDVNGSSAFWTDDTSTTDGDVDEDGFIEWKQALGTTKAGATTDANYAVYTGLSGSAVTFRGSVDSDARTVLSGFQIVAVPEPSTYLVFGGLALCFGLAGWWRKRRQAA